MPTPGKYSGSPQGGVGQSFERDSKELNDKLNPFINQIEDVGQIPFYQTGARAFIKVGGTPIGVCQSFRWSISYQATPIHTIDSVHPWDIDIGSVTISATLDNIMDPTKGPEADGLFHIMQAAIHQPYVELQVLDSLGTSLFFARGMFTGTSSSISRGALSTVSASFTGVAYQQNVNQSFEPYGIAGKLNALLGGLSGLAGGLSGGILQFPIDFNFIQSYNLGWCLKLWDFMHLEELKLETDMNERIERAKNQARAIVDGTDNSEAAIHYILRSVLSRRYNMPIFDDYFESRSIDELVFEIELWRALEETGAKRGGDLLKENKEEAESLFDDWAADEEPVPVSDEWNDTTTKELGNSWDKEAESFMKSGKFKGE